MSTTAHFFEGAPPSPLHAEAMLAKGSSQLTLTVDLTSFTKLRGNDALSLLSQLARQELRYRPGVISALREIYRFIADRDATSVKRASFVNFVGAILGATFPQLPAAGVDGLVNRLWINASTVSVDDSVTALVAHARKLYSTAIAKRDNDVRAASPTARSRLPSRAESRGVSPARSRDAGAAVAARARAAASAVDGADEVASQQRLLIDLHAEGADVRGGSALASRQGGQRHRANTVTMDVAAVPAASTAAGGAADLLEKAIEPAVDPSQAETVSRRQLYQALFWLADTLCVTSTEAEYTSFLQFWLAVAQVSD